VFQVDASFHIGDRRLLCLSQLNLRVLTAISSNFLEKPAKNLPLSYIGSHMNSCDATTGFAWHPTRHRPVHLPEDALKRSL